jgi:LmbE family N-acetylglucosaminyl deacetylase
MLQLSLSPPKSTNYSLLCLGAHSDDIEIGCGGTILSLLEQYDNVSVRWIVFSGSEVRACEAQASAAAFLNRAKSKEIIVKSHRDGFFPYSGPSLKEDFESLKIGCDPDLIFTHYGQDRHQDHRIISELTWNTFRNHMILEYEIPKYDGDFGQPNFFVPLSRSACTKKVSILLETFKSQESKQWFDEQMFQAILRLRGMEANSPTRYAEAFYCRKAVLAC